MKCAVCGERLAHNIYRSLEPGNMYWEEHQVCDCGYEEFKTSYGVSTVTVEGIVYERGDTSTIAGNLQAWRIWYAILAARGENA